jgi:UPF0716 protein FxsA
MRSRHRGTARRARATAATYRTGPALGWQPVVGILFLLFLALPFLELFVILQVGRSIGALNTVAVLILVSLVGAWLVKREGLGVLRRAQQRVADGAVPGRELVDGVLILFAGALLLTPGFLTDIVGVLLLLPPVRAALRTSAVRVLGRRGGLRVYRRR